MDNQIWEKPEIISWTQILLNSYKRLLNKELIERNEDLLTDSKNLYNADFVVLSHNNKPDPIYNYGNQQALDLWEMNWQQLIQTPSRNTTEPISREEREALLKEANLKGYITNYGGVRVSSTGKRYLIQDITLWNLFDSNGEYCGQAATFSHWQKLE
ncbi:MEKHLA domain-containing protein [Cyanobacterium aponinum UTEX 3222]|uniref:MEKHLA domain-containing protein n=1 Tax=Cyanobacterium aponinum AL20115 TaxID=3090662 RepID=A0AAF0ZGU4_9CHRO|nr:MEKHLA domain-containing protein [Cyanobacterium aponinum]PHV61203.1 MEKHLA domain-containing protein [Cyanobacterium aponinum IPPAS B-1201]WPF90223.1 MEKHLA domain-containing protein [Cyanobacterium aponinum AL20115]WRL38685.1 MEKHLA domain-containing protein [Cyanobacterium aponinum UTEX 3221]WRL41028.1 MEKHLA domain-containing protein [Cyanobacterium aponinum UTEX 3222]